VIISHQQQQSEQRQVTQAVSISQCSASYVSRKRDPAAFAAERRAAVCAAALLLVGTQRPPLSISAARAALSSKHTATRRDDETDRQ